MCCYNPLLIPDLTLCGLVSGIPHLLLLDRVGDLLLLLQLLLLQKGGHPTEEARCFSLLFLLLLLLHLLLLLALLWMSITWNSGRLDPLVPYSSLDSLFMDRPGSLVSNSADLVTNGSGQNTLL